MRTGQQNVYKQFVVWSMVPYSRPNMPISLSVCPVLTWKECRKTKIGVNVSNGRTNWCVILQFKLRSEVKQMAALRPFLEWNGLFDSRLLVALNLEWVCQLFWWVILSAMQIVEISIPWPYSVLTEIVCNKKKIKI